VRLYRVDFTQADREGTLYRRVRRLYSHLSEFTKPRSPFRSKYLLGGVGRLHAGYSAKQQNWNLHFDTTLEGRTIFLMTIDMFPHGASASKRGALSPIKITEEDLIRVVEDTNATGTSV
jgi:hypothetical protein